MDAGIQSQGERSEDFEIVCCTIMTLPSVALDSGIHARMTGLEIIVFNNKHLPRPINTFTVSVVLRYGAINSCHKSCQFGFCCSINPNFAIRDHFLSCFSRKIALSIIS